MITDFDVIQFLVILFAMGLSKMPKQAAIAACALIQLSIVICDYTMTGVAFYIVFFGIEFTAFWAFVIIARQWRSFENRLFFRLMGVLFLISSCVTLMYWTDGVYSHPLYVQMAQGVALIHVAVMLGYSDGIRQLARMASDAWCNLRRDLFDY